jgi:hypothetical protein
VAGILANDIWGEKERWKQCCGSEIIFFGSRSGCNLYSGSGLFVKNTFELQICRSSKHHKKAVFFKPVHLWIRIVDEKYI